MSNMVETGDLEITEPNECDLVGAGMGIGKRKRNPKMSTLNSSSNLMAAHFSACQVL